MTGEIRIRRLGRADYDGVWRSMVAHTAARDAETPDELWLCEHFPVYTLGQAGNPEDLLVENGIPLIRSDRGGQITYHAPGQVVVYLMLDLKRRKLSVHELVRRIEQSVIDFLAAHGVPAERVEGAPGVYVEKDGGKAKIAALGLRVRRRCCYHGLSLNVDLDLAPFSAINPCGFPGMAVTRTKDHGVALDAAQVSDALAERLIGQLTQSEKRGGE